jgi:hypothetical protein
MTEQLPRPLRIRQPGGGEPSGELGVAERIGEDTADSALVGRS